MPQGQQDAVTRKDREQRRHESIGRDQQGINEQHGSWSLFRGIPTRESTFKISHRPAECEGELSPALLNTTG